MKKNEKGFTLIELLAVIVILGLLMAIAIPSVTRYITQSRVKTLTKTMDSYITAVVQEVNDGDYKFSDGTKIYAIPIECVSLEKGGTNPFGEWMQANDNYWAYVLVQYDSENYNYKYGFTFKDSAGYGMYPTVSSKIGEKKDQVRTGYDDLTKPTNDKAINFVSSDKWDGFEITSDTELVVLESESEGNAGNGETTCTLCQKGDNYDAIEEEKAKEAIKDYTLVKTTSGSLNAFWYYKSDIKNITFQDSINIPNDAFKSWDISETGNGKVMAYIIPNANNSYRYDLFIQSDGEIYANPDSSYLFHFFYNLDSINNMDMLNTSLVENMSHMFDCIGRDSNIFTLDLGNNFDTSNVTNMSYMFGSAGKKSNVFTLDLGDKFDTSKVTNMEGMFQHTGGLSPVFTLDLGNKFDTSNVTNMKYMFSDMGLYSENLTLDLRDKFDTSNVTGMNYMFSNVGKSSSIFTLDLGDKFDTSNVTNMDHMFSNVGRSSSIFALDLGDKFDTSKVIDMFSMFENVGYSSTVFTLNLGNKFDTSNVISMRNMFSNTGRSASGFKLDCSGWNVDKVNDYSGFNSNVTSKVIPPTWK